MPLAQLVVCSDSPWRTPQNLPDEYLRTLRNEPANLPSVVLAVAAARGLVVGPADSAALGHLQASLRKNALRAFGLDRFSADEDKPPPPPVPSAHASAAIGEPDDGASKGDDDSEGEVESDEQDAFEGGGGAIGGSEAEAAAGDGGKGSKDDSVDALQLAALSMTLAVAGSVKPNYCCRKCRAFLFAKGDVLKAHGDPHAARTLFKDGPSEALCDAVLFLRPLPAAVAASSSHGESGGGAGRKTKGKAGHNTTPEAPPDRSKEYVPSSASPLVVMGSNVECSKCSSKLGRYAGGESPCACGTSVAGPILRVTALKVDFVDGHSALGALAERARAEAVDAAHEKDDDEDDGRSGSKKDKRKTKKRQTVTGDGGNGLGRNMQRGGSSKGGR
jgi:hypothetical protein